MMTRIRDNNDRIQEYRLKYSRAIKGSHEKYIGFEVGKSAKVWTSSLLRIGRSTAP